MEEPQPMLVVRELPHSAMSRWKLLDTLRERGWQRYAGRSRMGPANLEGGVRVHALSRYVSHHYVHALCLADDLLALGYTTIAHRQQAQYYRALLQ